MLWAAQQMKMSFSDIGNKSDVDKAVKKQSFHIPEGGLVHIPVREVSL